MTRARIALALLATLSLTAWTRAQSTWVVDALNRPGTDFTVFDDAVAASTNGDIVLVRWVDPTVTPYSGATIQHGLTVIGVGGQLGFVGSIRIQALPAGQHVVLRDLRLAPFVSTTTTGQCHLLLFSNSGTVHLHNIDRDRAPTSFPTANQIQITDCDLVTLTDCTLQAMYASLGVMNLARNRLVTMHGCHLTAGSISPTLPMNDSEVVLIDTIVEGYPATIGSGGPAASLCGTTLRVAGTSQVTGGFLAPAVTGYAGSCATNHLEIGPAATVGGATNSIVTYTFVPALGARIDQNHGLDVTLEGEPSSFVLLRAGFPAITPAIAYGGLVYLDPTLSFSLLGLLTDSTGRATWSPQLPATVPPGTGFWLQGVSLGNAGIRVTTAGAVVTP